MRTNYIIFLIRFRSHFTCEYRLPIGKYHAALRHITCADGANIDLLEYPLIRFRSHFMCEYRLPIGKYRAALRHITCADGANIDLHIVPSSTVAATTVPLLHKARQSRAGEGWCVERRNDSSPTPSSRFQRATFPAIGKVYPTKLGKAERAKVGVWDGQQATATDWRVLKRT